MAVLIDRSVRLPESEYFPQVRQKSGIAIRHRAEEAPHPARVRHRALRRRGYRSGDREEHAVTIAYPRRHDLTRYGNATYEDSPATCNGRLQACGTLLQADVGRASIHITPLQIRIGAMSTPVTPVRIDTGPMSIGRTRHRHTSAHCQFTSHWCDFARRCGESTWAACQLPRVREIRVTPVSIHIRLLHRCVFTHSSLSQGGLYEIPSNGGRDRCARAADGRWPHAGAGRLSVAAGPGGRIAGPARPVQRRRHRRLIPYFLLHPFGDLLHGARPGDDRQHTQLAVVQNQRRG